MRKELRAEAYTVKLTKIFSGSKSGDGAKNGKRENDLG